MYTFTVFTLLLAAEPSPAQPAPAGPAVVGEEDRRLFDRLRPQFEALAAKKVEEALAKEIQKTALELSAAQTDPDDPLLKRGLGGLLATAIIGLVKAILAKSLYAMVLAVIIALFWSYWPAVLTFLVGVVGLVAAPVGWLAGKARK